MYRRDLLGLSAGMACALAGCSGSGSDTVTPVIGDEGDVPTVEFGRTVAFENDIAVTVEGIEYFEDRTYVTEGTEEERTDRPDPGNVFAIVSVTAANNNDEEVPQQPFPAHREFALEIGGSRYDHMPTIHPDRFEAGPPPELGEERSGVIRFQIPEESRGQDPVVVLEFLFAGQHHSIGWTVS